MRQIKFRAWSGQRMFYPGDGYMDTTIFDYDKATGQNEAWKVGEGNWDGEVNGAGWHIWRTDSQSEFLMQFTGLFDSAGKEIYEGDIVEFTFADTTATKEIFKVSWLDHKARFVLIDVRGNDWSFTYQNRMQIVGNVYQNPGLLL